MAHPLLSLLAEAGVIATLRAPSPAAAHAAVSALLRGGVRAIEITYTTPHAGAVIADLAARYGEEILLGAGTLTTPDQVREASDAGAAFLVSPGYDADVVEAVLATRRLSMIGGFTPTEVMRLARIGVDVVKLFPGSLGGPGLLRALRGPFPDLDYIPTGGVSDTNLAAWLEAGALAVGAGSELIPRDALARGDLEQITEQARRFMRAFAAVRN